MNQFSPVTSENTPRRHPRWPFIRRAAIDPLLNSYREALRAADAEIAALTRRAESAENGWQAAEAHLVEMRQERLDLLHECQVLRTDLDATRRVAEDATRLHRAGAEEIVNLHSQLRDRDKRVAELEAKLAKINPPRKRYGSKKQDAENAASESEATHG